MTAPVVNMARAELSAKIEMGEGGRFLLDATIDGRPLTEDERAELRAAGAADLKAADVLLQARSAGLDMYVATTHQLLALLGPWWSDGLTLDAVLDVVPAGIRDEAALLVQILNAMAGQ